MQLFYKNITNNARKYFVDAAGRIGSNAACCGRIEVTQNVMR